MKDNFNLKILLDHKSSELDKTYLIHSSIVPRRQTYAHTDFEPPAHFQMGRKSATNGFPMAPKYS